MLCALCDPIVFTSMEHTKLIICLEECEGQIDKMINFVYSMDVNTMGSQSVHSIV